MINELSWVNKPTHYTTAESGFWQEWDFGPISELDLHRRATQQVPIKGEFVHALAFDTPHEGKDFARWDCVNGWTSLGGREKLV